MPRRTKTNTVAGAVKAMANARIVIEPPKDMKLSKAERIKFDRIIASRAPEKWDEVDINQACNLASCLVEIDEIKAELKKTGRTLVNDRGTTVANPLQSMMDAAVRRSITLGRYLHTNPEAKQSKPREERKSNQAAQDAKAISAPVSLIKQPA